MRPSRGCKIGARPPPSPGKSRPIIFCYIFSPYGFSCYFFSLWGLFLLFLFLIGRGAFSPYGGLLATFFSLWGPFPQCGGLFHFLWMSFLQLAPPPTHYENFSGRPCHPYNFFTIQKIKNTIFGIPSNMNMPLPTG